MNKRRKILYLAAMIILIIIMIAIMTFKEMYYNIQNPPKNLLVAGSTTLNLYLRALADSFMKVYPNITVITAGGGSTAGLIAVKKGAIDIGGTSRELTGAEDDEYTKAYLIGRDGVAIVVPKVNPVSNLSIDQIRDIFEGRIDNWKDVGGNDAPIAVFIRDEEATTRGGFEELVMSGAEYVPTAVTCNSHPELAAAMDKNVNSIGYFRDHWLSSELGKNLKALSIDGVQLSEKAELTGQYPLTRSFFFVFDGDPKGIAKLFLDYACSEAGQAVMTKLGAIAVY